MADSLATAYEPTLPDSGVSGKQRMDGLDYVSLYWEGGTEEKPGKVDRWWRVVVGLSKQSRIERDLEPALLRFRLKLARLSSKTLPAPQFSSYPAALAIFL